ncbi:MAG: hypothetical protein ABJO09_07385 [Hyphomicrobiales bacterium]
MKIIVAIAIAVVVLLAGFYLYSGENTGSPDSAPVAEEAPAAPAEPAQPEPLN